MRVSRSAIMTGAGEAVLGALDRTNGRYTPTLLFERAVMGVCYFALLAATTGVGYDKPIKGGTIHVL